MDSAHHIIRVAPVASIFWNKPPSTEIFLQSFLTYLIILSRMNFKTNILFVENCIPQKETSTQKNIPLYNPIGLITCITRFEY